MSSEFRYLVRIRGKDLEGRKKLVPALADLRGVGDNFAQSIVFSLGLDPKARLGTLSDSQLKELEKVLIAGSSLKVPQWALNRRRDPDTGETKQLVGTDLVQSVPLVCSAALGQVLFGNVELGLTASLLIGAASRKS